MKKVYVIMDYSRPVVVCECKHDVEVMADSMDKTFVEAPFIKGDCPVKDGGNHEEAF